VVLILAFKIH